MRSGNLRARHDALIREIVKDPEFYIADNGTIWTSRSTNGHLSNPEVWRRAGRVDSDGYIQISYKGARIFAHRISYFKHHGSLMNDLVVNHIDRNRQNNSPDNLEQVTQSSNRYHTYRNRDKGGEDDRQAA